MIDLYELKQLAAFARLGTLSKVSEEFHISTPSVTRAMQNLENCFGVALFTRSKNKISLNSTGIAAAKYAEKLLDEAERCVRQVRDFDRRQKTVVVKSCAPAPLWTLLPKLNALYPDITVSSAICQNDEVLAAWNDNSCDIAVLPFSFGSGKAAAKKFMQEHLFVSVPPSHELAKHKALTFEEINGFNFLLRSELGFWDTLCRKKMPASKFLVQNDEFDFYELVRTSSLPCFTTDYGLLHLNADSGRVNIPLTDSEANITFYLASKKNFCVI